jgi:hypothetical protein
MKMTCSTASSAIFGAFLVNIAGGGNRIPVLPNQQYTFSAYVKDIDTTASITPKLEWYVGEVGYVGEVNVGISSGSSTSITSTGWTRVTVLATAPSSANFVTPCVYTTAAVANAKEFLIDSCLLEPSSVLKPYFDGSYDGQNYSDDRDSIWEGTAHSSVSHLYYNRVFNSGKIDSMITDGMFYA